VSVGAADWVMALGGIVVAVASAMGLAAWIEVADAWANGAGDASEGDDVADATGLDTACADGRHATNDSATATTIAGRTKRTFTQPCFTTTTTSNESSP
jgi:hypothetical protein